MSNIRIVNHHVNFAHRGKRKVYAWLNDVAKKEEHLIESLTIILCSDKFLLTMNRKYLKHNYYTDVITFDLSDIPQIIIGEIYISLDRVKENAMKFKNTYAEELNRVIVHGLLHLCGHKDKTTHEAKFMKKNEDEYLKHLATTIIYG